MVLRGAPPAQGGIQVLGALAGHVLCDHAAAVPAVRRVLRAFGFSSSTECWTFQLHADLGTHSAHCAADRGDLTGTVLGMVLVAPVVVQQQVPWLGSRSAWFDDGHMFCVIQGGLWKKFTIFSI